MARPFTAVNLAAMGRMEGAGGTARSEGPWDFFRRRAARAVKSKDKDWVKREGQPEE